MPSNDLQFLFSHSERKEKSMKKVILILTSCLFLTSFLAGCDDSYDSSESSSSSNSTSSYSYSGSSNPSSKSTSSYSYSGSSNPYSKGGSKYDEPIYENPVTGKVEYSQKDMEDFVANLHW